MQSCGLERVGLSYAFLEYMTAYYFHTNYPEYTLYAYCMLCNVSRHRCDKVSGNNLRYMYYHSQEAILN